MLWFLIPEAVTESEHTVPLCQRSGTGLFGTTGNHLTPGLPILSLGNTLYHLQVSNYTVYFHFSHAVPSRQNALRPLTYLANSC